jgi:hypothetical protein
MGKMIKNEIDGKYFRARVVSTHSPCNNRHKISHFAAKSPLTYKFPLSYTQTIKKEVLINDHWLVSRTSGCAKQHPAYRSFETLSGC